MKFIKYNNNNISRLSLGTVQFGLDYGVANDSGKPTEDSVKEIINYLYYNGINCLDTAQEYGNSEEVIGNSTQYLKDIFVVSKVKSGDFESSVEEKVLKSLNNLKIKSLYALLLHDSSLLYNWKKEYAKTIDKLVDSNKIKYFGVSIYTSEEFNLAMENEKIKVIQVPFNIFDQRAILEKWFERAKEKNKLLFVRSIFLQGLLLMDKKNIPINLKTSLKYIDKFEEFCKKLNMTKNELSLSFVSSVAKDSLLLFGCDNLEQAQQNLNVFNKLKVLDNSIIKEISKEFESIDETIYNPSKWDVK